MRTKTLLLTAAIGAAGVATSMAQVFSVNAVGYVNTTIPANGFALISNPLIAQDNSLNALFAGVPAGFQVYKFTGTGYLTATYDDLDGAFVGDGANETVMPGEGVFVSNPTGEPVTITFVGEVPQGTLNNSLPAGLSIRSSMVPQAGTAAELGLPANAGDQLYDWNPDTQSYAAHTFDDLDNSWNPALTPLAVGEAFFLSRTQEGTWTRTFNVNGQ